MKRKDEYQIQELPKYLAQKEVETLFKKIKDRRDKALFALIYRYGLRVSEAMLLTPKDIDYNRKKVSIRRVKNGISAERRLYPDVERLLKTYLKVRKNTGSALFTGREGNLKRTMIYKLFKNYAKKAKLKTEYSVHSLRHSCGVHLLEAGADIREVQDFLGHRNIQNTLIYTQITDKIRRRTDDLAEFSPEIVRM